MFEFLKRLRRSVPVKIVGFVNPEVTFTSDQEINLGRLDVVADVEGEKIRARLDVKEISENQCMGILVEPQEAVPFLKEIFRPYYEKRNELRVGRNLRVLSKDIPGFKGTSRDLSEHGMRLEVSGPIPIGKPISLAIDLDDLAGSTLELHGQTRWCAPKENTPYSLVGILFVDVPPQAQNALRAFLNTLIEAEKGNMKLGGA